jgi:hypothetical protein
VLPAGSFIIASHGSDQGYIQMELDTVSHQDDQGHPIHGTTYEVLLNAINNHTIEIPDALINPRPQGAPATAIFSIRGCNIGSAQPFLVQMKAALGGKVQVSAPKKFDNNKTMAQGAFEFLAYNFFILRRDPFANRRQVLNAFRNHAPHFQFIDGNDVPDANWNHWIPRSVRPGERNNVPAPFWSFGQQVERQQRIRIPVEFRHNYPPSFGRYSYTIINVAHNPGNHAARMQVLQDSLNNNPVFQADYGFPGYERWGYASLQDFIDGYHWVFNYNPHHQRLVCTGHRHLYVVAPPVTDPANNHLLFNYYPDNKDPAATVEALSNFAAAQPAQFQELFETV